jgi:hypothetical protein
MWQENGGTKSSNLEPEVHQQAAESSVELEAPTPSAPIDDLAQGPVQGGFDAPLRVDIEILERYSSQMCPLKEFETTDIQRRNFLQPNSSQITE